MSNAWTIRPLVWERIDTTYWRAFSLFGQYSIHKHGAMYVTNADGKKHRSLSDAQRSVQEHHERKIEPALAPATDRSVIEEVRAALAALIDHVEGDMGVTADNPYLARATAALAKLDAMGVR